jgi:hypothetical protein
VCVFVCFSGFNSGGKRLIRPGASPQAARSRFVFLFQVFVARRTHGSGFRPRVGHRADVEVGIGINERSK